MVDETADVERAAFDRKEPDCNHSDRQAVDGAAFDREPLEREALERDVLEREVLEREVLEREVREAMRAVANLNDQLTQAYLCGDGPRIERILAEISAAERQRNRLVQRALADRPNISATLPIREQVTRVLGLLQRPASVALIRDVAAARFGDSIAGPRLASLRRDEHRSWTSATSKGGQRAVSRPVYVVPALTYDRMAPMRGVLALSSWPVAARLIAPASPRVDMLHMIDRLVGEAFNSPNAAWAPDLRRLLWRLGRTVPGGEGADLTGLRAAIATELTQLDPVDTAERASAAKKATKHFAEEHQLFGAAAVAEPTHA